MSSVNNSRRIPLRWNIALKSGKNVSIIISIVQQTNLAWQASSVQEYSQMWKWEDYTRYKVICVFGTHGKSSLCRQNLSAWREPSSTSRRELFSSSYPLFTMLIRAKMAGIQVNKYPVLVLSVIHVHHEQCLVQYDVYSVNFRVWHNWSGEFSC